MSDHSYESSDAPIFIFLDPIAWSLKLKSRLDELIGVCLPDCSIKDSICESSELGSDEKKQSRLVSPSFLEALRGVLEVLREALGVAGWGAFSVALS